MKKDNHLSPVEQIEAQEKQKSNHLAPVLLGLFFLVGIGLVSLTVNDLLFSNTEPVKNTEVFSSALKPSIPEPEAFEEVLKTQKVQSLNGGHDIIKQPKKPAISSSGCKYVGYGEKCRIMKYGCAEGFEYCRDAVGCGCKEKVNIPTLPVIKPETPKPIIQEPEEVPRPPQKPVIKKPYQAKSTWGSYFLKNAAVPQNKFQAFYFNHGIKTKISDSQDFLEFLKKDTHHVKLEELKPQVLEQKITDEVSLNNNDLTANLAPEAFGAYWVGEFEFKEKVTKEIIIDGGQSHSRVIINGKAIFDAKGGQTQSYTFNPGKHRIEVEFINQWHTVDFHVLIKSPQAKLNTKQTREYIKKSMTKNDEIWYVGVYETDTKDQVLKIKLKRLDKPVFLVLSSYDRVKWEIDNPENTEIKAVLINSHSPASSVQFLQKFNDKKIKYLERSTLETVYGSTPQCNNLSDHFYCDHKGLLELSKSAKEIFGREVDGFSGHYYGQEMNPNIPEILVNEDLIQKNQADYDRMKLQSLENNAQSLFND